MVLAGGDDGGGRASVETINQVHSGLATVITAEAAVAVAVNEKVLTESAAATAASTAKCLLTTNCSGN